MEKLIELLNDYQYGAFVYENEQLRFRMGSKVKIGGEPILISKSFGFIKWLVENEKIDRHKFYDKNILKGFVTLTKEEKADSIIMNLSVQDEPIEFLISILN